MKQAVIYLRVSTEEQVKGMSLDNQLLACQQWAASNGLVVLKIFTDEGVSAKSLNRPQMNQLLEYLEENKGHIGYVVTYQTDRLTRSAADYYVLQSRLQRLGIEYKNTNNSLKTDASEGLVNGLSALVAEYDNKLKGERTRDNMKRHTAEGYRMHKAPYGLRNVRDAADRPILEPVPQLADLVAELLQEFAKGIYNIRELLELAHAKGLVRANGKPMTYSLMGKMLRNPIYAGYEQTKLTDGKLVKSGFDGIIDLHTYYTNQSLLSKHKNHKVSGYTVNNPVFPLRRFLLCADCGSPLRGSSPTGRSGKSYPKYHCSSKQCGKSVSTDDLHVQFSEKLKEFELSETAQKLYKQLVIRVWNDEVKHLQGKRRKLERQVYELEQKKHLVFDKYLKEEIDLSEKQSFYQRTDLEIADVKASIGSLNEKTGDRQAVIDHAFNFLTNTAAYWESANVDTQMQLQSLLFPEGMPYNLRTKNFGTAKISELYRLVSIQKGAEAPNVSTLVTPRGIEPRLLG